MRLVYRITNEVLRDLIRSEHNGFLSLLMEKVNIQREIAIQNNKLTTFNFLVFFPFKLIFFLFYFILFYFLD